MIFLLGLCNEGIDIHKRLDDTHATLAECEVVWGKKKNHNGSNMKLAQT